MNYFQTKLAAEVRDQSRVVAAAWRNDGGDDDDDDGLSELLNVEDKHKLNK